MSQKEFEHNAQGAKTMASISGEPHNQDYWAGYLRGLRRNYHGEKFGTVTEHNLWMNTLNETHGEQRSHRGKGYQAGYAGMSISDAIINCKSTGVL